MLLIFQLHNTLNKMVVYASEQIKPLGINHDSSLSLLVQNLILTIGKVMKLTAQDASFTNQETAIQEKVCDKITRVFCRI